LFVLFVQTVALNFYLVMHYSAKCSLVLACRLSICQSVTLVDCGWWIGWKYWKLIIAWTIIPFALRSPKAIHLLPGEHGEILWRLDYWWPHLPSMKKLACI